MQEYKTELRAYFIYQNTVFPINVVSTLWLTAEHYSAHYQCENGLNTSQYLVINSVFLDEKLAYALSHTLMESKMESAVMEAVKKLKTKKTILLTNWLFSVSKEKQEKSIAEQNQ